MSAAENKYVKTVLSEKLFTGDTLPRPMSPSSWVGAVTYTPITVITIKRAFREWKSNCVYLTELVMVLNWKLWQWHEHGNEALASLYNRLWKEADLYACENLTGDDLSYFYNTTD